MTLHGLALFCIIYLLATAAPGPGITALLARVLSRGASGVGYFIAGFVVGDLVWVTLAATGMAALAQTAHTAFVVVRFAGALYLLYLAYRLWTAPAQPLGDGDEGAAAQRPSRQFLGSFALTMGNPKVMVFFLAILPTVVDLSRLNVVDFLTLCAAICSILSCVLVAYVLAALRARRLFRSARAVRWLNRGSGTVMAGAAAAVASQ